MLMEISRMDFHTCAVFFDRLVDLIPAKHYMADEEERVEVRYLQKSERESVREQFKKKYKESKKAKLDPELAGGTLKALQQHKSTTRKEQVLSHGGDVGNGKVMKPNEELRMKLQKRLEDMRNQRKAEEKETKVKSVTNWKDEALSQGRKKAAAQQKQARQKMSKVDRLEKDNKIRNKMAGKQEQKAGSKAGDIDFSFGKLDFGQDHGPRTGKKKLSKQELLEKVEKDQEKVLSKEEEKKKAWKAALARAHGEKVLDDPKLLKKSIKKEAKLKDKKTKAWNERMEKVKEKQSQRQQKRKDNLQSRIDAKKSAKKERREKKLLRAGFEGRKKDFISSPN
jgi:hypothetical protein